MQQVGAFLFYLEKNLLKRLPDVVSRHIFTTSFNDKAKKEMISTLALSRTYYEAALAGTKTASSCLLRVPGMALNHLVGSVRTNGRGYFAYTKEGLPIRVQPQYTPGGLVALCEPLKHDAELGTTYFWDFPRGACPVQREPEFQTMRAADARITLRIENVRAVRLSDFDDEMAIAQGVWLAAGGEFSFSAGERVQVKQPTPVAAFTEGFLKRYKLPIHDYWTWVYDFTIFQNLKSPSNGYEWLNYRPD